MDVRKIVLFDIDGTLTEQDKGLSGLHMDSFAHGFKKVYGVSATIQEINYMGKTDRQIIREVLKKHNLDDNTINAGLDKMFKAAISYFKDNIKNVRDSTGLLDGVKECLNELCKNDSYILGLVTGNMKEIARSKLELLGIWNCFKIGGFGNTTEVRADLVRDCIEQAAEKYKANIPKDRVYVVGDTPFDILCAKQNDVISIAVTTGKYKRENLMESKPDYIIDNLMELPTLIKTL